MSSQAEDSEHRVEPLRFHDPPAAARGRLKQVLASLPRARVVAEEGAYLRAEFTSLVFRFVDDVEFLFDDAAGRIDVRSASRKGHSDLGVNRHRVQQIRERFEPRG